MKLGDQEKKWAPHIVCHTCVEHLWKWTQGKIKSLPFAIPMVWREPASHEDCYFCLTKIKGYNSKNKANVVFPEIISAIRPVPHGPDLPVNGHKMHGKTLSRTLECQYVGRLLLGAKKRH